MRVLCACTHTHTLLKVSHGYTMARSPLVITENTIFVCVIKSIIPVEMKLYTREVVLRSNKK